MNPEHWPVWWLMLCAGVGGFAAGVVTSAGMASRVAVRAMRELDATRVERVRRELERQRGGNGGTIPPA